MKVFSTELHRDSEKEAWNTYVSGYECGSLYGMAEWGDVIRDVYGHDSIRLVAIAEGAGGREIVGVLPLVAMRSRIFGNRLVSMPYLDMGGVVADTPEVEKALIAKALEVGGQIRAKRIEVRQVSALSGLEGLDRVRLGQGDIPFFVFREKERMLLTLPSTAGALWASFKSKLRSQIRRAMKEGLTVHIGESELVDAFYTVFAENMRDLGSPVHAKALFSGVMKAFKGRAKIVVIQKGEITVSASLMCAHGDTLQNPWASSLRRYGHFSSNMLLYWSMLEYACENKCTTFDFGRSTPGEGTYRFKRQWGAEPHSLHWYQFIPEGATDADRKGDDKARFGKSIKYWQKMPVPLTTLIGPMVRGQISL